MLDAEQESRLRLSEQLLELSQHSSEIEMRASLSHMYYAVHHAARVLTGRSRQRQASIHTDVRDDVKRLDRKLGEQIARLSEMRIKVDYEPGFIKDDYGSIAEFRAKFQDQMQAGAEAHQRLKELIEGTIDKK